MHPSPAALLTMSDAELDAYYDDLRRLWLDAKRSGDYDAYRGRMKLIEAIQEDRKQSKDSVLESKRKLTDDEILAWTLAHAVATLDGPEDAALSDLLHEYGGKLGIDVPAGDEYQRAVLHHFDPDRVPDFPIDPEAEADFERIQSNR